jgi:DNA polymerase subunit Cdc27
VLKARLISVTKNEYVYESFSEDDESDATKEKRSAVQGPAHTGGDKKKGKGAAAGQKSLMSFFGK